MKRLLTILLICSATILSSAQEKKYSLNAIAFYNLENLFDTVDDPNNPGDDEFLPTSAYNWSQEKYEKKLFNLANVISKLARDYCPLGPAVIGVTEIENRKVLEDLVVRKELRDMKLQIVHQDSPDRRGIDVALLYNPDLFTVESYRLFPYQTSDTTFVTRDHLLVTGEIAGERIHVIVNHWPSRYGSKSSPRREAAAAGVKMLVDSLNVAETNPKIIIMGDLNDDPVDISTRVVLNAKKKMSDVKDGGLYNPMWKLYENGVGSLAYQGKWSLFDQIIVSKGLLNEDKSTLSFLKAEIFNRDFLVTKEGKNKGYPFRTFSGSSFINGYSDHFPVYIYLVKENAQ